jgi:hypothetical protein
MLPRVQVFHENLEQAMAPLAGENAVVAAALCNGSMAKYQASEGSQQVDHAASDPKAPLPGGDRGFRN